MYTFAILIGLYSYSIFFLGVFHILYPLIIKTLTAVFIIFLFILLLKHHSFHFPLPKSRLSIFILLLIGGQIVTNLIGALGPELAFDALWYHLTLPKIFLENHTIFHIPGGLFYYSDMPKLGEMLYIGSLSLGTEIYAKLLHFAFGIGSSIIIYKLSRRYFTSILSLLCVLIFYTNLVINFESITAYIDLIRTFFEILGVFAWIQYTESKYKKYFFLSAILIGLAITTKVLALDSLCIIILLTIFFELHHKMPFIKIIRNVMIYNMLALSIPLPWFIFSFIHTHNPFYPFFTPIFHTIHMSFWNSSLFHPITFLSTYWNLFTHASDPLSPFYMGFLPLIIISFFQCKTSIKYLYIYSLCGLLSWYGISTIEGSRLLLPYISILIIPMVASIEAINKRIDRKNITIKIAFLFICILSIISIGYRILANKKYILYILHRETKSQFLTNHLNFEFGDFYDTDNYFTSHIKKSDLVVLIGFHNEFYVDFPSIDSSYIQRGQKFNYIAIQNGNLPREYADANLEYTNTKTHVKLYYIGNTIWEK